MTVGAIRIAASFGWWRSLVLVGSLFFLLSVWSCERYTAEFQTFAALDWLEAHPPLDQAGTIPTAASLAESGAVNFAELPSRGSASPFVPAFAPPDLFQKSVSGVRDGAEIVASQGPTADGATAAATLDVVVFHRSLRADAWFGLMALETEAGHPSDYGPGIRTSGPDERDVTWVVPPHSDPPFGEAIVLGTRGPVAFRIRTRLVPGSSASSDGVNSAALAEELARRLTGQWTTWLTQQSFSRGW